MDSCAVETGLLRKKPCGHAAVARCLNCEQPLCAQHAVAQLTQAGNKSGKFMCQECIAAQREHDKAMAGVAKSEQEKKLAALAKSYGAPPPEKKPAAPAPAAAAAAKDAAAKAEAPQEPEALEFTPKDGKFEYTRKTDKDPGFKPD